MLAFQKILSSEVDSKWGGKIYHLIFHRTSPDECFCKHLTYLRSTGLIKVGLYFFSETQKDKNSGKIKLF